MTSFERLKFKRCENAIAGMRADDEYRKKENKGMLLRRYGLTEEEYDAMLEATGGKCPICEVDLDFREDARSGECPVVDHCHHCGSDGKRNPIGN